jgi:PKD repeat protein
MTTQTLAQLYATVVGGGFTYTASPGGEPFENDASTATVVFNETGATPPVPSFTATVPSTVTSNVQPLTVTFTDTSTGTPTAWLWNFGDGSTATTATASHTYVNDGVYDVTLTVTSATGSASVIQSGLVIVSEIEQVTPANPTVEGSASSVASFTASATSGTHPLTVTFTDTSTNSPYKWSWDFGDSGKSSVQNPVYVFGHAGTFSVTLSVENAGGLDMSVPTIITVA